MDKKCTLFAEECSMSKGVREHLRSLGYEVLPVVGVEGIRRLGGGLPDMTLRQWYKGQLATNTYFGDGGINEGASDETLERMVKFLGRIADALIKEDESHGN